MDRLRVLFVSSRREDAGMLTQILKPESIEFKHVSSLEDARQTLGQVSFGAVLTEAYLQDGDWKDVLGATWELETVPAVVVTHRFADDRFWAEVLNLGCYDMLAQPFDASEVRRILTSACGHPDARPAACAWQTSRTLREAS